MGLLSTLKNLFSGLGFVVTEGARPLSADEERAIAMGHVYAAEGALPVNVLTMEADARTASKLLTRAWGVSDHNSYLETMRWLRDSGHRTVYPIIAPLVERSYSQRLMPKAARALQDEAVTEAVRQGLDAAEVENHYRGWMGSTVMGGQAELPDQLPSSIAAWDCARAVQLSRLAVDAGFTTDTEAFGLLQEFVAISREHHRSWQEFGDAFLTGRAFWSARDAKNPVDQELHKFTYARDNLMKREDSPWQTIAW
ncbi:DUF1266 domain-containing protein [Curtobacterium poinsettiae]|uniref:DUF1266 domain-containing protein n=1 Tax=Curtobacterium poinsettiae TaxID=159612 RepID=UPI00235DFD4B|nr:DUF1266 domain-containing protein [Curtobacterium flaccumfaciens]MDD1386795.1 DUF1266 domain-containing protein [Curtobacterium flaccumfaciens pv. poinsettiae]